MTKRMVVKKKNEGESLLTWYLRLAACSSKFSVNFSRKYDGSLIYKENSGSESCYNSNAVNTRTETNSLKLLFVRQSNMKMYSLSRNAKIALLLFILLSFHVYNCRSGCQVQKKKKKTEPLLDKITRFGGR